MKRNVIGVDKGFLGEGHDCWECKRDPKRTGMTPAPAMATKLIVFIESFAKSKVEQRTYYYVIHLFFFFKNKINKFKKKKT